MPKFASSINLQKNELLNAKIQNLSGHPTVTANDAGMIYFDTADKHFYIYDGTAWLQLDGVLAHNHDTSYQAKENTLTSLGLSGTGILAKTSTGTITPRTITAGAGVSVTNGDGVGGNPTIALPTVGSAGEKNPVVTVDAYGRVTSARPLVVGDLPDITHTKVTDFDTQVRSSRLDQMAAPGSDVGMNGKHITSLADPTSAQDAATKNYVDNAIQGLNAKASVRAVSTAAVNLLSPPAALDGITLAQGDRILLKDQTAGAENGIYVVGLGAWTRADDANTFNELPSAYVWVREGSVWANTGWLCTSLPGGTLGTTGLIWVQFSAAGQIDAGDGLTRTTNGNEINVGAGNGITVYADSVAANLDAAGGLEFNGTAIRAKLSGATLTRDANGLSVTSPKLKNTSDCGTTNPWVITHNLGTRDVTVTILEKSTWAVVYADIVITDTNTVTVTFAIAPTAAQYHAIILG